MNIFIEKSANKNSLAKRKLVYGVGKNDAWYSSSRTVNGKRTKCPFYMRWKGMLARCYDKKYHKKHQTYKVCSVCPEWLRFSTFKGWMEKQNWQGMQLDKDLINPNSKTYSPENCAFVSGAINTLMNDSMESRGSCPIGVTYDKVNGKFQANSGRYGKKKHLGRFATPEEAHNAWRTAKAAHIVEVVNNTQGLDMRVYDALIDRAAKVADLKSPLTT